MFAKDIKVLTEQNSNFRKVLHTGQKCQIVAMNIKEGEDIGEEVHNKVDQIIFIVKGLGEAILAGKRKKINENDVVFIPAGTIHNIKNIGKKNLKLFTVYAPPNHPDNTVHKTKAEADSF